MRSGWAVWPEARRRLEAAGVAVRSLEEVSRLSDELAEEWDLGAQRLREHFGYPEIPLLQRH